MWHVSVTRHFILPGCSLSSPGCCSVGMLLGWWFGRCSYRLLMTGLDSEAFSQLCEIIYWLYNFICQGKKLISRSSIRRGGSSWHNDRYSDKEVGLGKTYGVWFFFFFNFSFSSPLRSEWRLSWELHSHGDQKKHFRDELLLQKKS